MLTANCIGHLGSDAEVKTANGREFTTFRVANSNRWTDDAGNVHEDTQWIDCIMQGKPNVLPYLKRGQQVYVAGSCQTRIYSSKKDRCMKAGLTINVRSVELIGGKSDDIPAVLYNANTGEQIDVIKFYCATSLVRDASQPEYVPLVSRSQGQYVCDRNGWIQPFKEEGAADEQ